MFLNQHRELGQTAEPWQCAPLDRLIGEPKVRESLHEGGDGELRFETRERRAEAEVGSAAE
jgi:hypothetical protein